MGQTLDPRTRAFVTGAFRSLQMVELDELYMGDRTREEQRACQLTLTIERLQAELKDLTARMDWVSEGEE
jgi:hypothetical protein